MGLIDQVFDELERKPDTGFVKWGYRHSSIDNHPVGRIVDKCHASSPEITAKNMILIWK